MGSQAPYALPASHRDVSIGILLTVAALCSLTQIWTADGELFERVGPKNCLHNG